MCYSWQGLIFVSGFDGWLLKLSQNSDVDLVLSHYLCERLILHWKVLEALVFTKTLAQQKANWNLSTPDSLVLMINVQNLLTVNVKMLRIEFRENTNSKMSAYVGSRNCIFIQRHAHTTCMQFFPVIFLITWTSLGYLERPVCIH